MPGWSQLREAAAVVDSGGIICFPTDTVYGFAASIYCRPAVERLRELKGRRSDRAFVVLVSDIDQVAELATDVTPAHTTLMETYWPGPLTIVFQASEAVPEYLTGGDGTVALRVPDDALTQSVLRACGVPLAAPSANPKGGGPALSPEQVLRQFRGKIELLLDGGVVGSALPSTIVAVRDRGLRVLRRGAIALGEALD
jgi:L-threonylcarbamoyladenylate synthase